MDHERTTARWKIIQAANKYKLRMRFRPRLFGMKQIHQAVFICRQRKLVKPELLEQAGFNGTKAK